MSDNALDTSKATEGDTVTVTVTADEPITAPTVTCNGNTYTVTGTSPSTTYTATRVVQAGDTEGALVCTLTGFTDETGNTPGSVTADPGCGVTVDVTDPTAQYCAMSDNALDTSKAMEGDTVTVTVTADEPITAPTVTCNGNTYTVTGTSPSTTYTATRVVQAGDTEGAIVCTVTGFTDETGNTPGSVTADPGCGVTVDLTDPTAQYCAMSDNALDTSKAMEGDTVTVTVTADEPITTPTVTCNGNTYTVTGTNPSTTYTATRVVQAGDTEGTIVCTVTGFTDETGNTPGSVTADPGCGVTVDVTDPTAQYCAMSDNALDTSKAMEGDTVTVTVTADEPITTPTVTCNGNTYTVTGTSPSTTYTATRVVQASDTEGALVCTLTGFTDETGNTPGSVTADPGCGVTVDITDPSGTFCVSAVSSPAVPSDTVTVQIFASEAVSTPSVTCAGSIVTMTGDTPMTTFTGTFVVSMGSTEGVVSCIISALQDETGNIGGAPTQDPNPSCTVTIKTTSDSPSATSSMSRTSSASRSATASRSPSATPSRSATASRSPSATPSRSATASRSPSATPSRSPSASTTPSKSASPSPSATASVSPSPAAVSPSASPSPSPLFEFAMDMVDFNAACVQGTCQGYSTAVINNITATTNTRTIGVRPYINFAWNFLTQGAGTGICTVSVSLSSCSRAPDTAQITNYAYENLKVYIQQGDARGYPPFTKPFQFLPGSTAPNAYTTAAYAGQVDCVGRNNQAFFVAFQQPRTCWYDTYFSMEICHMGTSSATSISGGGTWIASDGTQLVASTPQLKLICVSSV